MEKEIYELICPVCYLDYIFNAETEGVNKEEINRIEDVLSRYYAISVKDEDPFFSHRNDFNKLGADCVTLTALKYD